MKYTVKLSKEEFEWLNTFDENFHSALIKIKSGCISHKELKSEHKEILAKLEDLSSQIDGLKRY